MATILTDDNYKLIYLEKSIVAIANIISRDINRKLSTREITDLATYISQLKPSTFIGKNLAAAQLQIARNFIAYKNHPNITGDEQVISKLGLDIVRDDGNFLDQYQKDELNQLTTDENSYKFSVFANRRGNAIIDEKHYQKKINFSKDEFYKTVITSLTTVKSFFSSDNIEGIFRRFHSIFTTYQNITLPHQILSLDSRYRIEPSNYYQWNIFTAGNTGTRGNVRMQDTLQQIIQMQVFSFWLPIPTNTNVYYKKIRMLVHEFNSQSIPVTEYQGTNNTPIAYNYHFEFNVADQQANRLYLVPETPFFKFRKPVNSVSSITLSFRNPFNLIDVPTDTGTYVVTYGNPTVYTLTNHGLSTGDLVYILNSPTGDSALNEEITSENGHTITVIDPNNWSITVDSSSEAGSDTGIQVYYGTFRLFLSFEFTSIEQ